MAKVKQVHSLLKGAFFLTAAGIISKLLSAGYRIPLQNIAGDLGFYIYQQVYPILGIALTLSLYGFPAAISKLASEMRQEEGALSLRFFYLPVLTCITAICGVIFVAGYTQADYIAAIMGDSQLIPSLQAAFFIFLIIPFTSLIRGGYQGLNNMGPTAVSQTFEQLTRVIVIIFTAVFIIEEHGVYFIGVGAAVGSFVGSLTAFLFLLTISRGKFRGAKKHVHLSATFYIKAIVFYGLFICLNYMLLLLLQLIDSLTLVPMLTQAGVEIDTAKVLKGVFDRGQPLIQLGTVMASSIALALIPSVTRKRLNANQIEVYGYISAGVKFSFLIASGATVGLVVLFPEINQLFFQDGKGNSPLRLFMVVIWFSSLVITMSSVLQGLGYVMHTALLVLGGIIIKCVGNLYLVPLFELHGAALGSIFSVAFVMVGNIIILRREVPLKKWLSVPWRAAIIALVGMTFVLISFSTVEQLFSLVKGRFSLLVYTLFLTAVGAVVYFVLLIRLGALTKRELESLPYSHWFLRLLPKGRKI